MMAPAGNFWQNSFKIKITSQINHNHKTDFIYMGDYAMKKLLTAALGVVILSTGAASADVRELRVTTAAPEKTPWGVYFKKANAEAEKISKNTMKLNMFWSSQLGDEQTSIRQTVKGRIDISGQSGVATSLIVPEFSLLGAPYLFDTVEQSDCVFDNHVRPIFEKRMQNSGLVTLSWVEVGKPLIFSNTPIKTVADIQNFKLRVPPARSNALYFEEVGANGVPMGVVDMVPALKTGQVNGISTSTVYGIAIGLHKLAANVLDNFITHDIGTVTVSKKIWKTLSADQQKGLNSYDTLVNELRVGIRKTEEALKGKVAAAGIPVYRPTEAEMKEWRKAASPAQDKLVKEIGGDAPAIWDAIMKAKTACKA